MAGEWHMESFENLIDVKHGFAFAGEHIHEEPRGDVLLTPGNFAVGGGFKGDKFKYYDGSVPDEYVLDEGDLIVTMTDLSKQSDTLGYPVFVPASRDGRRFLHNQRLGKVVLRNPKALDAKYLYYVMCGQEYRHEVLASAPRDPSVDCPACDWRYYAKHQYRHPCPRTYRSSARRGATCL